MSTSVATPLVERIRAEFDATLAPGVAAPLAAQRRSALQAALAAGLPGNRDDGFRYAQLRPLEKLKFSALAPPTEATVNRAAALLPAPLPGFERIVYVDGHLCASLCSAAAQLLASASRATLGGAVLDRETGISAVDATPGAPAGQRFALINAAFSAETLRIAIGRGAPPCQIELIFVALADGNAGASYPRVSLDCAAQSQLVLVERHIGDGETASFSNASVELRLANDARCTHHRLQSLGTRAMHIETLRASLGTAAHYSLHGLHTGAASTRSTMAIELAGNGSSVDVHAAQVAGGTQVQDTQLTIEHRGAATTTTETFRGIGSGRARIAFNGHMIVRETARGANTQQSLRCLLAGPETEADLRPQLEIYTDDVRASHGATAGKLDENMLFYLLSRGIDRDTAQNLLKWAFVAEVITRIEIPQLRQDAQQLVLGRVQGLIGEALS